MPKKPIKIPPREVRLQPTSIDSADATEGSPSVISSQGIKEGYGEGVKTQSEVDGFVPATMKNFAAGITYEIVTAIGTINVGTPEAPIYEKAYQVTKKYADDKILSSALDEYENYVRGGNAFNVQGSSVPGTTVPVPGGTTVPPVAVGYPIVVQVGTNYNDVCGMVAKLYYIKHPPPIANGDKLYSDPETTIQVTGGAFVLPEDGQIRGGWPGGGVGAPSGNYCIIPVPALRDSVSVKLNGVAHTILSDGAVNVQLTSSGNLIGKLLGYRFRVSVPLNGPGINFKDEYSVTSLNEDEFDAVVDAGAWLVTIAIFRSFNGGVNVNFVSAPSKVITAKNLTIETVRLRRASDGFIFDIPVGESSVAMGPLDSLQHEVIAHGNDPAYRFTFLKDDATLAPLEVPNPHDLEKNNYSTGFHVLNADITDFNILRIEPVPATTTVPPTTVPETTTVPPTTVPETTTVPPTTVPVAGDEVELLDKLVEQELEKKSKTKKK
jgi:hypothetical protein